MSSRTRPQVELRTGYFGKLPTQGDFVSHGLSRGMINALDDWLRQCVRESQRALGRDWLDSFLVAPAWNGLVGGGVLSPDPVMLVMIPSVDRVGRYFPLVIATPLPGHAGRLDHLIQDMSAWFEWAEARAHSVLEAGFNRSGLDHDLAAMQFLFTPVTRAATNNGANQSLWWTRGGAVLRTDGLPDPASFHQQLLRQPLSGADEPAPTPEAPATPQRVLLSAESGGAAVKAARKATLTDAVAISPDGQAMSLLSGIGHVPGLNDAVKDAAATLATIENPFSMNDLIAEAKGKLGTVNTKLRARGLPTGRVFAASAGVLLIQGGRYALFWSGNVRAYMMRDGRFTQLTRDHVDRMIPTMINRALGAEMRPNVETTAGEAMAGDRFLLCSGGVHAVLSEHDMSRVLGSAATAQRAADHLAQDAIIAGAAMDAAAVTVILKARLPAEGTLANELKGKEE
ncbi:type VI secretion system-associated protein TagF [Ruegeria jejuensis]|uniref:type VI secretion system-associated protein TagF n=1 Tax=Ruegeria jejuensis TaxID=3233338 RepID=UPI00355B6244